ncbi:MAG: thioredoxin domain-containing protein [Alphaproteobacteria bacterium]|nr:thioredoxin domain-containing protein [Alphaproteobacteria bacterium]
MPRPELTIIAAGTAIVAVVLALVFFLFAPSDSSDGAPKLPMTLRDDDMILGKDDAPITMIEYASMTCGHCSRFHQTVFPSIKKNYIEAGLVKFVFREYPLDDVAMAGSVVARCLPRDQYFRFVGLLFENQSTWAFVPDPRTGLIEISRRAGLSREQVETCLKNRVEIDRINAIVADAQSLYRVSATPTFVINGQIVSGEHSFSEFEELFKSMLPEADAPN